MDSTGSIHTANKRPDSSRNFVLSARFVSSPVVVLPSAPSRELNEDDIALQESWPAYGESTPPISPSSSFSSCPTSSASSPRAPSPTARAVVSPLVVVSSPSLPHSHPAPPPPVLELMADVQVQLDQLQQQLSSLQKLPPTPESLQNISQLQQTRASLLQLQLKSPSTPTSIHAALAAAEPSQQSRPSSTSIISMHTTPEKSPTKVAPPPPTENISPPPLSSVSSSSLAFTTPQRKPPPAATASSDSSLTSPPSSTAPASSSYPSPSILSVLSPPLTSQTLNTRSARLSSMASSDGDDFDGQSVASQATVESKGEEREEEVEDLEEALLKHSHAGVSKTTLVVTKDSEQIKTMKTFLSGGLKMLTPQKMERETSDQRPPRSFAPPAGLKKWKTENAEITKIGTEFLSCGEVSGVELWKVEGFEMVQIETRSKFYAQDSYLILQTSEHPHTGKLTHEVFLMHGSASLPEHRMIAGIKLLELTRALRGGAKVFYETAGQESDNLFGCFVTHGIDYRGFLDGGTPSAMVHVEAAADHIPVLLQVKGTKRGCIVRILAVDVPEFNTGDVFVLFSIDAVYVWMGHLSNYEERVRGLRLGMEIKGWKANTGPGWGYRVCSFHSMREGEETPEFWEFFGGPQEILEADNCDEEFAEASLREPALSLYHLHELVTDDSLHGLDPPLDLSYNGFHEILFMPWYHDNPWPPPRTPPLLGAVASEEAVTIAVNALQAGRREANQNNFNFTGTKDVACFKVLMDGLSLVPRAEHGVFSLAYHYVILHTFYNTHNKERTAVYFWQSPAASTMTLMKWKMQLKPTLEKSLKEVTKLSPISITLMQGEESGTFLLLFPQGIIVLQPDGPKGVPEPEAKPIPKPPGSKREAKEKHSQMFRISGCFYINGAKPRSEEPEDKPAPRRGRIIADSGALVERVFARAIEISTDSAQLCSASAFILKQDYHPYCLFVWVGRFCSELEREAAEKMANKLLETSGSKVEEGGAAKKNEDRLTALYNAGKTRNKRVIFVEEDEEPEEFWSTFPGGNQKAVDLYKSKRADAKKNPKFNKAICNFECRLIMLSFKLELKKEDREDTAVEVLQADEIKCANLADLEEGPVYVLETFATLHIWNPAGRASQHLLLSAHLFAQKYAEILSQRRLRGKVSVAKQLNSGAHFFPYTTSISRKAAFSDPYDKNEEALIALGVQGRVVKPKAASNAPNNATSPTTATPSSSLPSAAFSTPVSASSVSVTTPLIKTTPKPSHTKRSSRTGSIVGFGSTITNTPKQPEQKKPLSFTSPSSSSSPSFHSSSASATPTTANASTNNNITAAPLTNSNVDVTTPILSALPSPAVVIAPPSCSPRLSQEEEEEEPAALEFALRERAELVAQSAASVTEAKLAAMKKRETLSKQMYADRRKSLQQQNSVLMLVEAMDTEIIRRRSTVDEAGTPRRIRSTSRADNIARSSGIKPPTRVSSLIQKIETEPKSVATVKPLSLQEMKRAPSVTTANKLDQKKLEAWNKVNDPPLSRARSASNSSTASGISTMSSSGISRLRTPQGTSSIPLSSSSSVSASPILSKPAFSFAAPLPPTPNLPKSSSFISTKAIPPAAPPKSPAPAPAVPSSTSTTTITRNSSSSPTLKPASPTNKTVPKIVTTPPTAPPSPTSKISSSSSITSASKSLFSKLTSTTSVVTTTPSSLPAPKPTMSKSASTSRLPQPKNVGVKPRFQI